MFKRHLIFAAAGLGLLFPWDNYIRAQPTTGTASAGNRVDEVVRELRSGRLGPEDAGAELARLGSAELPPLADLSKDSNRNVRLAVVWTIAGRNDPKNVGILLEGLSDKDPTVRSESLFVASKISKIDLNVARKEYYKGEFRQKLIGVARSHISGCSVAVQLLGDFQDVEAIPEIRNLLDAAGGVQLQKGQANVIFVNKEATNIMWDVPGDLFRDDCLKVLFRLGERRAEVSVEDSFVEDNPTSRSIAIGCVLYSEREEYLPFLIPLLNDTRTGAVVGPQSRPRSATKWQPPTLRVQDMAALTILRLLGLDRSMFSIDSENRLDGQEFEKIRQLATARVNTASDGRSFVKVR